MVNKKAVKYVACGIVGFALAVLIDKPELLEPTLMDFLPDAALLLALPTSTANESLEGDRDSQDE